MWLLLLSKRREILDVYFQLLILKLVNFSRFSTVIVYRRQSGVGMAKTGRGSRLVTIVMRHIVCKSWRSFALCNIKMFMASRPPMSMWTCSCACTEECYCCLALRTLKEESSKPSFPILVGGPVLD
ncbi:hypothetical protein L1887_34289 [Cichorium endivia]|nr:hypothetical protein L1887_34289 [Cichorium endivia]